MELEKKVLQEIIDMLDEQEGEKLKKHPKLMAMQVEVKKPEAEDAGEPGEKPEGTPADMQEDADEGEIDPEILKKLLEQFSE